MARAAAAIARATAAKSAFLKQALEAATTPDLESLDTTTGTSKSGTTPSSAAVSSSAGEAQKPSAFTAAVATTAASLPLSSSFSSSQKNQGLAALVTGTGGVVAPSYLTAGSVNKKKLTLEPFLELLKEVERCCLAEEEEDASFVEAHLKDEGLSDSHA